MLYPKGNMSKRTVRPPDRYLHENIEIAIDGKRAEDRKYCMSSCLYTDYYYYYYVYGIVSAKRDLVHIIKFVIKMPYV